MPGKCGCDTGGPLYAVLDYKTGEPNGYLLCSACGHEWAPGALQDGGDPYADAQALWARMEEAAK